jgi:hypothetical protein
MGEYITSLVEIREAGVTVNSTGEHVVRVLGARREASLDIHFGAKEEMLLADTSQYQRLHAGELTPPANEAGAPGGPFEVPQVFAPGDGRILFLKRGGT